ncbi:hypothetical protein [Gilliamella apicola]|uniref:hypothetical protein n=1 Tax=unclassified Gilliamella TaxID=2685620 RepID=UPI00080E142B|nr:hypothetical protein A9G32_07915 [Gilliamella apicola]OCG48313.1 hypothetical protein A9G26_00925 [Gilliamella apicola]OCG54236.1 hypothetical protein A9G27_07475 [Gilliamella apicola]
MDIKLTKHDKRYIESTDDVYSIMQRVLLRENKIDQEKEHLWIIGMNQAGYILYIELIALGSYKNAFFTFSPNIKFQLTIHPINTLMVPLISQLSDEIKTFESPSVNAGQ